MSGDSGSSTTGKRNKALYAHFASVTSSPDKADVFPKKSQSMQ